MLMKWKFLSEDLLFDDHFASRRKFIAPVIAAAGISAAGSLLNNFMSADYSDHAAKENRKWMEAMYEKYQSPAAMMRQYREANLNPYLLGESVGTGSIPSSSQAQLPNFENVGASAVQGYGMASQFELNAGAAANQRSEYVLNSIRSINEAFIQGGYDSGMVMINQLMPEFNALGLDSHQVMSLTASIRASTQAKSEIDKVESEWQKEYGSELRSTELMELNQRISLLVGQANLMQSQSELNKSQTRLNENEIKVQAAKVVELLASAFNLRKQGEYYDISASTARQIQSYVINSLILNNGLRGLAFKQGQLQFEEFRSGHDTRNYMETNSQMLKWYMQALNGSFHVSGGFNFTDVLRGLD